MVVNGQLSTWSVDGAETLVDVIQQTLNFPQFVGLVDVCTFVVDEMQEAEDLHEMLRRHRLTETRCLYQLVS